MIAVAALVGCAAGGAASGTAAVVGASVGGFVPDGQRYVAYPTLDGTLRVLDDRTNTSFDAGHPPWCEASRGLTVETTGSGLVVVECNAPDDTLQTALLDVASRAWSQPVGATAAAQENLTLR